MDENFVFNVNLRPALLILIPDRVRRKVHPRLEPSERRGWLLTTV